MATERLDYHGHARLRGLLAAGDPACEVAAAHNAKECLRELYTLWAQPDIAGQWLNALIADLAHHQTPELRGMAGTRVAGDAKSSPGTPPAPPTVPPTD
jgi:hypothetical protein